MVKMCVIGIALMVVGGATCAEHVMCPGVGVARNEPSDTTIGVGQSFVARHYEGGMCVGDESSKNLRLVSIKSWYSPDSSIIHVDAATGRVTGKAVGDARLSSFEHGFTVPVRVR